VVIPVEDGVAKPRKAGALSRALTPSPELAVIVGDEPLARTEIVKRLWDYIRAHGCQDHADKRVIVADDKLRAVFGQDRVNMMKMMGLLSPHLRAV
jgi:DNA topoisomerase-3